MTLIETITEYYAHPEIFASSWAVDLIGRKLNYTPNAILHGLRMQATIHWNNCTTEHSNCVEVGRSTADRYMLELANGRHDLHPSEDDEVSSLAFKIHNASGHGKPGIMTYSYVVGPHDQPCDCYEKAYIKWLGKAMITATIIDPDDLYYEPRFE